MSMTDKKTFESEFEAWKWVHEMFPDTQWYLDHESSERAGYKIYRDIEEFYNYVCELGDRVEINLKDGNQTINLWIEKEESDIKGSETSTEIRHSYWQCSNVRMSSRDITCRYCHRTETISNGNEDFEYCPHCGAKMDGKDGE